MSYTIEMHMRVYDDNEGRYITVAPDRDGLGLVEVSTAGESAEYFGKISLPMEADFALKLAEAIIDVATRAKRQKP